MDYEESAPENAEGGDISAENNVASGVPEETTAPVDQGVPESQPDSEDKPKYNKVCPSVLKGEPCWALSRGKPCHYAKHERDGSSGGSQGSHPANYPPVSSNVYVCHLPVSMTKDQLHSMFSPYGTVRECKLLVEPRTQEPKGVGFIHFTTPQEAKNAIDGIHGLVITGSDKALECRMAKPNPGRSRDGPEGGFRGRGPRGPPRRRGGDEYELPRGPPRDYGRYDDYPPPRGYDYGRRPLPPYEDDYDYGPVRRPPLGPRPSPYGRPEPRRGPPPPRGEYDLYDSYGPPPPRRREDYDPYLEGPEYYSGAPSGLPFPRAGPPPPGFGPRTDYVTLPPVMAPPRR